jgi:hypothetical protein
MSIYFVMGLLSGTIVGLLGLAMHAWMSRDKHRCEEFTQWDDMLVHYSYPADPTNPREVQAYTQGEPVRGTRRQQQRRCTICGKIEIRKLPK